MFRLRSTIKSVHKKNKIWKLIPAFELPKEEKKKKREKEITKNGEKGV